MVARTLRLRLLAWRAGVASWRDIARAMDERVLAAVLFLAAGTGALVQRTLPERFAGPHVSIALALAACAVGALAWRLPWATWPADAQLAFPLGGFGLIVAAAIDQPRVTAATVVAGLTLLFMVTGTAQRPGRCLLLAPIAIVAMMLATTAGSTPSATGTEILLGVGAATASGEAIALVLRRQRHAERRVRALLEAVREMSAVDDGSRAPRCLAELTADLLDAHAVAVLLRVSPRSTRLMSRATAG